MGSYAILWDGSRMNNLVDQAVIPGDIVGKISGSQEGLRLGPGLTQNGEAIVATKAGILRHRAPDKFWIENSQKRYMPATDDVVIGIVTERLGEGFKVDIGTHQPATLSIYQFEGGTKRNRPNLAIGSIVYARMIVANKDMEPEISCVNAASGKSEGFGPLEGGYVFKCSTGLARQCMDQDCPVLNLLGAALPFEIAVGINGRIWINSGSVDHSIVLSNAIINSEYMTENQVKVMVDELLTRVKSR